MEKDTVLVLDENDNIIGSESKKKSHVFSTEQPRGVLHRAFSVFIFDESTNELLLQQRAASKITFPSVSKYNTACATCSYQYLPGMVPVPAAGTIPYLVFARTERVECTSTLLLVPGTGTELYLWWCIMIMNK
jgi:isopentenyl-diphosphate delta-isomerase